jgi:SAM-dependent methyltransferase
VAGRAWWETFFEGGWAVIHADVIPAEETAEHVESIARLLALEPGARLLDVPCGDGRVALPLAARGIRVTGVELNERLLEYARARAGEQGLDVEWRLGDMRDLPWQGEFDAALCFSGSFGYFDEGGNRDFVVSVRRALKPGGRFLVDTHVQETLLPILQERGWRRVDATLVLEERHVDHEHGRIDAEWTFVRDGRTWTGTTSVRLYTYRELQQLLLAAGFTRVDGYGLDDEPFSVPESRRLRAVATA